MQIQSFDKENLNEIQNIRGGQQSRIHRLGGVPTPKKSIHKQGPVKTVDNNSIFIRFQQTNPFFQVQKALQQNPLKIATNQKCFQDVLMQVYQMKNICEKLLTQDVDQKIECPKTLIMDLQNLQTRRTNIDQTEDSNKLKYRMSIKDHMNEQFSLCEHDKCDEINTVLSMALKKIQELTQNSENLSKVLQDQKYEKQKAEKQNSYLRSKIAKIDEEKCNQLRKLRQQIQRLKKNGSHWSQLKIYEVGRVAVDNHSVKHIQQSLRVPLKNIQVKQDKEQQQIKVIQSKLQQSQVAILPNKLKHVVYL